MHEASLAAGVLQQVELAAQREGFVRVIEIRLAVGQLAGVDVRALRFALESLAPATLLAGATLVIEEPAGRAWCPTCAQSVALNQRGDACAQCGGYGLQVTQGTTLRVVDLIVADT